MTKITVQELLFNEQPITINRKLAKCLGLKESIIFQQLHYWLEINKKTGNNFKENKYWTYNSIKKWHENEFDFLSERTVERTLKKLEDSGLIIAKTFNKMKGDKTKWYTIDYNKLLQVCENKLNEKEILSAKRSIAGKKGAEKKKTKNENTIPPSWQNGEPFCQLGRTIPPTWQNDTTNLAEPIPKTTTKISTKTTTCSSSEIDLSSLDSTNKNIKFNIDDIKKNKSIHLINLFESNICELKQTPFIKFINYIDDVDNNFLKAVIEYCAEINIKSFAGFKKVIDSYINKNILTKEEMFKDIEKYRNSKKNNTNNYIKKSNTKENKFIDYEGQREYDYDSLERKLLGWD